MRPVRWFASNFRAGCTPKRRKHSPEQVNPLSSLPVFFPALQPSWGTSASARPRRSRTSRLGLCDHVARPARSPGGYQVRSHTITFLCSIPVCACLQDCKLFARGTQGCGRCSGMNLPRFSAKKASTRHKCPMLFRAFCPSPICFHTHSRVDLHF